MHYLPGKLVKFAKKSHIMWKVDSLYGSEMLTVIGDLLNFATVDDFSIYLSDIVSYIIGAMRYFYGYMLKDIKVALGYG